MTDSAPLLGAIIAALLILSGIAVVVAAVAFVSLQDFFVRMHPPALTYTFGTWSVALAGIIQMAVLEGRLMVHPVIIIFLLFMTVPVTTLLLARVALFRRRIAGVADTPAALSAPRDA